ncbi:hypothetical protein K7X08_036558 [Anisodus acutangulus]|uniref:Uncharacterized protein n=1 Tax=Anisodus acutangulus TaxID=402998 RepID=A0A9Q1QWZ6_9SOLA|nr:hypothetical protein K7X08_036558 [Anisodus acutangulus]
MKWWPDVICFASASTHSSLQFSNVKARKETTEQMSSKIDHTSKSFTSSLCSCFCYNRVARAVLTADTGYKGSDNSRGGAAVVMMVVVQVEEPSFSSFLTRT